jgi:hypothetical protein
MWVVVLATVDEVLEGGSVGRAIANVMAATMPVNRK